MSILRMKEGVGVQDFSSVHEARTEYLYPKIKKPEEFQKLYLSEAEVCEFWERGCLTNVPILTREQCEEMLEECGSLMESSQPHVGQSLMYEYHSNQSSDPDNVLVHALGHWRILPIFHDLVFHPKVIVPASQLLQKDQLSPVRFWHDQFFAKPAHHGGVVAWHQDYSYWTRTKPMMHLTVHIALEDQTVDNGCIHYIPGSHRWTRNGGAPLPVLDFNFKDMESIKTILTPDELSGFKPEPALLRQGEAAFHHPLMVHGSYCNRSDAPRRATVLNYFADGVCSDTDDAMVMAPGQDMTHSAASNIPKGEKMEGQFYPLVYDPKWAV